MEFSSMLVFSWLDPPLHITSYFKDINFSVCGPYCRRMKHEDEEEDKEMELFENFKNHINPLPMDKMFLISL